MTPILIISFNRLTVLQKLLDRLDCLKHKRIIIVDNASTYPPLLEFFRDLGQKAEIVRMDKNYGHMVLHQVWAERQLRVHLGLEDMNYIYTDNDMMPEYDCPNDYIEKFSSVLNKYPWVKKVGLSIRIDDLPDTFEKKGILTRWESQFWRRGFRDTELNLDLYHAAIDTTFAMQRAGQRADYVDGSVCLRTGPPYIAKHFPWYIDSKNLSDEDKYYIETAGEFETHFPHRYGKEPPPE